LSLPAIGIPNARVIGIFNAGPHPGVIFLGHVPEEEKRSAWHARTSWSLRPFVRAGSLS